MDFRFFLSYALLRERDTIIIIIIIVTWSFLARSDLLESGNSFSHPEPSLFFRNIMDGMAWHVMIAGELDSIAQRHHCFLVSSPFDRKTWAGSLPPWLRGVGGVYLYVWIYGLDIFFTEGLPKEGRCYEVCHSWVCMIVTKHADLTTILALVSSDGLWDVIVTIIVGTSIYIYPRLRLQT